MIHMSICSIASTVSLLNNPALYCDYAGERRFLILLNKVDLASCLEKNLKAPWYVHVQGMCFSVSVKIWPTSILTGRDYATQASTINIRPDPPSQ